MELKTHNWVAMGISLVVLLSSLFMESGSMSFFLIGIAVIIGAGPIVLSIMQESAMDAEKEEMFLEFSRNLVESVKAGNPISKSILNIKNKHYGALSVHVRKLANQISIGIPLNVALRTFSIDVKKGTKEKYIEKSALKTIGAFLNTEGGDLLIGINDDGEILGTDEEIQKFYKNEDKYLLNFKNHLKTKIGEGFYPLIDYQVVQIDGKRVLHVSCSSSTAPCFIEDKEFYVRSGPSTDMLNGKKQHEYIKERF